jgi:hypothetical protein
MFAARLDANSPIPGTQGKLRRLLDGIRARKPDYDGMDPIFAQLVKRNFSHLHAGLVTRGAIHSVTFLKALSPGWDIYEVHSAHAKVRWRIALGSDGKILGAVPMYFDGGPIA